MTNDISEDNNELEADGVLGLSFSGENVERPSFIEYLR
jgi:hypothetical protein